MTNNKKDIKKKMFLNCLTDMKFPIIFEIISAELTLLLPTLIAMLMGNLTDYMLAFDLTGVKAKIVPFIIAIIIFIFGEPVFSLLRNLNIFSKSLVNDRTVLKQYLHKNLKSAKSMGEGQVCDRLEWDLVQYRFNTINILSGPIIAMIYIVQTLLLLDKNIYLPYLLIIAIVSVFPVVISYVCRNINAKCLDGSLEFEEKRKNEEYVFLDSHDYIRGNLLNKPFLDKYKKLFDKYMNDFGNTEIKKNSAVKVLTDVLNYFAQIVLVLVGACFLSFGKIKPGEIMSALILLTPFVSWYIYMGDFIKAIKERKVIQDRTSYIYEDEEKFSGNSSQLVINSIETKKLSFQYSDTDKAIDLPNINISSGEKLLLTGENGKGKTTLATVLAGLFSDYSGEIYVNNQNINSINLDNLRKRISFAEQTPFLLNTSIKENIQFTNNSVVDEKLKSLIKIFNLKLPLDYVVSSEQNNLSGGEKQKISLIRAFYKDADIVILDEPTNQLEADSRKALIKYIQDSDKMIFVISHDKEVKEAFKNMNLKTIS